MNTALKSAKYIAAGIVLAIVAVLCALYLSACQGFQVTGKLCRTLDDGTTICASSTGTGGVVIEATQKAKP